MRQLLAILGLILLIISLSAVSKGDNWIALLSLVAAIVCFVPIRRRMREIDNNRRQMEDSARQLRYDAAQKETALFEGLSKT